MPNVSINWPNIAKSLLEGNATRDIWTSLTRFATDEAKTELHRKGDLDAEVVENVVQEILLKLQDEQKLTFFCQADSPQSYLRTMVRNEVVDQFRSKKTNLQSCQEYAERIVFERSPGPLDPADEALSNERTSQLLDAIKSLSELDQDLLHSFYLGEEKIGELAAKHGITPSNVTTRLRRAKDKLENHTQLRKHIQTQH